MNGIWRQARKSILIAYADFVFHTNFIAFMILFALAISAALYSPVDVFYEFGWTGLNFFVISGVSSGRNPAIFLL